MSRVKVVTKFVVMPLLLVLVATAVSDAQDQKKRRTQRRRGSRASATSLLRMSQVHAELKLTDKQKERLKKIARPSLRNVSREERTKKLAEYRKTSNAVIKKVLNEGQQKRLNQLLLQRQGYRALGTAVVAKAVGLSKEQSKKIETALKTSRTGRRTNFRNLSDEERKKLIAQRRERSAKRQKAVMAVLNDKQKVKFEKMKGKKFKFPSRRRRRTSR